jgi:hypothetical protein
VESVSFRWVAIAASPFRYRVVPVRSTLWEGGSRALAIAIRQASCELEMVPSLHSNLAGAASATGGGLAGAAAGWGAGACAIDF